MTWVLSKGISNALIIGQAPAQHDDPSMPITGRTGRRLADLMGIPFEQYLCTFDRANLLDRWPGKHGPGDAFPKVEALSGGVSLWNRYLYDMNCTYDWVLLLGRSVERIMFRRPPGPWLKWELILPQAMNMAVIPHPSGVNRWWNDASNVEAARQFLTEWRENIDGQRTEASVLDRGDA